MPLPRMTEVELIDYVLGQVSELEETTARAMLRFEGLPADDLSVRRLVFSRYLCITLRLREHST